MSIWSDMPDFFLSVILGGLYAVMDERGADVGLRTRGAKLMNATGFSPWMVVRLPFL